MMLTGCRVDLSLKQKAAAEGLESSLLEQLSTLEGNLNVHREEKTALEEKILRLEDR